MYILIVGATGVLGKETTRQLLAAGHKVRAMTRDNAPEEAVQKIRERLGLTRPLHEQYLIFMLGNDTAARVRYEVARLTGDPIPMPEVTETFRGILRGDFKTRMEGWAAAVQNGINTPNEVRRRENLPDHPDGRDQV